MDLDKRIQQLRKDAGLSQEQLAERLGVSRQAVGKWESGQGSPGFDRLTGLCEVLDVTMSQLLGEEVKGNKDKARKYHWAAAGAAALLILLAVLFIYKERKDMGQLRSDLDRLEGQLNSVYENVNLQISSLVSGINDQLVQSESLVADYSAEILSVDMETTEITYRVEAVPKVFSEGTKAKFVLSSKEESVSADGIQENGSFTATLSAPSSSLMKLSIQLEKDGEVKSQLLEAMYEPASSYIMSVETQGQLNYRKISSDSLDISGTIDVIVTAAMDETTGSYKNYPLSANIQVMKNGEVIGTFQVPVYGWDQSGGNSSGAVETLSGCTYYVDVSQPVKNFNSGDIIETVLNVEDNFGNRRKLTVETYEIK